MIAKEKIKYVASMSVDKLKEFFVGQILTVELVNRSSIPIETYLIKDIKKNDKYHYCTFTCYDLIENQESGLNIFHEEVYDLLKYFTFTTYHSTNEPMYKHTIQV